ncbi:MAG: hypothetical protein EYC71_09670 [Gammaproteobacteria bacterium]|nr:MAG: hypothetical protein EYC71_09670 [Gammaproteobacteria bacterium]
MASEKAAMKSTRALSGKTKAGTAKSATRRRSSAGAAPPPGPGGDGEPWETAFSLNLDAIKAYRIVVGGHGVVIPLPPRPPRRIVVEVIWKKFR